MASELKAAETFVEKPKTLAGLRAEIAAGRTKAVDLAADYYERIEKINRRLNVYLSLTKERALRQAERIDALAANVNVVPEIPVIVVERFPPDAPAPVTMIGSLTTNPAAFATVRDFVPVVMVPVVIAHVQTVARI